MDKPTFTVKISFSDGADDTASGSAGDAPSRQLLDAATGREGREPLTFGVADWVWDVHCDRRTLRLVLDRPQHADRLHLH
jgi:hypothetical protein